MPGVNEETYLSHTLLVLEAHICVCIYIFLLGVSEFNVLLCVKVDFF